MQQHTSTNLGCGRCGYPVQGLSELKCPECGADLTEVGIIKGGNARTKIIAILTPLIYTVVLVVVAFIAFKALQQILPTYSDAYYSIQIEPGSGEYKEAGLHINANLIQPPPRAQSVNVSVSPSSGPMTTVTMCNPGTTIEVYNVNILFKLNAFNDKLGSPEVAVSVDPGTLQMTWYETSTLSHQTPVAFTDQDLLTAFASYGMDTSRLDVQTEAKQLHAFVTDFINGQHQLTLSAFNSRAYGGARNLASGPPMFMSFYIVGWCVVWLIGFILLIKRARKRAWGGPEQK